MQRSIKLFNILTLTIAISPSNKLILANQTTQEQPKDMLKRIGIVPNMIAEQHLYKDFRSCVDDLKSGEIFKLVEKQEGYAWAHITR